MGRNNIQCFRSLPKKGACHLKHLFSNCGTTPTLAKNAILLDNQTMSAQEILIEEIKHQPEPVLREVLHYLKFIQRQRAEENWADVLPSREVEQEKLDLLDGK
jgi:hypothetical protein